MKYTHYLLVRVADGDGLTQTEWDTAWTDIKAAGVDLEDRWTDASEHFGAESYVALISEEEAEKIGNALPMGTSTIYMVIRELWESFAAAAALARPQTSLDPNGVRLARMDAYDRWAQEQRCAD